MGLDGIGWDGIESRIGWDGIRMGWDRMGLYRIWIG